MSSGLLPRRLPVTLVRFGRRFPKTVLLAAGLIWLLAAVMATRIRVDTELLSLVPQDNQVVRDFQTSIERFGSVDTLLAVVRLPGDEDLEPAIAYADLLVEELTASELIDWVEYRLEGSAAAIAPLLDRATLFLQPAEVDALLAELDEEGLRATAQRLRSHLLGPQGVVASEVLRLDPAMLLSRVLGRVRVGGLGISVDPDSGCLIDPGRRMLLVLAQPIRPAQDLRFDRELVDELDRMVVRSRAAWTEAGWAGEPPAVEFTGGYVITLDDSQLISRDAVTGIVSSLIGVMLLFLLAFRRRAALVYAIVPLVTGLALTFVFGAVVLGRLNSLTAAFGGLLIGLGIDFVIVLYGRYIEERQNGADHDAALELMGRHTGTSVLLGAVTTAATFYAFLVTDFRGLSELGLLTGTGILLLVASVYLALPALLTLLHHRASRVATKRLYLHSFGSDLVCRWALRHRRATLVVAALATVMLAAGVGRLEFDDDLRNMRSAGNQGVLLRDEVMEAFGLRFSPFTVRVDGATESEAMDRARAVLADLQPLVDGDSLGGIDTIVGLIPPAEAQHEVIARLEAASARSLGAADRLAAALRAEGLNPEPFRAGLDAFQRALEVQEPLSVGELRGTALERAVDRYVAFHDQGVSVAIYCYPPAGRWRRDVPPALLNVVGRQPWSVLSSTVVVSAELRRIVWRDAAWASVVGLVLVYLLIWADLGGTVRALLALVPLVVGVAWMLGAMAWLGIRVNLMNIFVLTMVIGIGVDYGLHLLHRWFESGGRTEAVAETAKAIAVAALTTMVGFGSLVLSHYPGLRSIGAVAILGAVSTAVLSITVLPVLLAVSRGSRDKGEESLS